MLKIKKGRKSKITKIRLSFKASIIMLTKSVAWLAREMVEKENGTENNLKKIN